MRHLLVDHARAKARLKRGGNYVFADKPQDALGADPWKLLELHDLLDRLADLDGRAAQIVEMHCFMGLSQAEIATALEISSRTVKRDWQIAKAWLESELAERNGR